MLSAPLRAVLGAATVLTISVVPGVTALAATPAASVVDVAAFGARPGDGHDDLAAFRAAFASTASRPGAIVHVPSGVFQLSSRLDVPDSVGGLAMQPGTVLRGEGSNEVLRRRGSAVATAIAVTRPVAAEQATLTLASTTGIAVGSWLYVGSDDYYAAKNMRPGYLRRVVSVAAGVVRLDQPVHRALNRAPRVWRYHLSPSFTLTGGTIEQAKPLTVREPSVSLIGVNSPFVQGVTIRNCGGPGLRVADSVRASINVNVHDCLDDESGTRYHAGQHYGYGVELQGAVRDSTVRGTATRVRHAFTTNPSYTPVLKTMLKMGEPEHITVTMKVAQTSSTGLDTHEAGWDIRFVGCTVTDPGRYRAAGSTDGKEGGGGLFLRARKVSVTRTTVSGASGPSLTTAAPSGTDRAWTAADRAVINGLVVSNTRAKAVVQLFQPAVLTDVRISAASAIGVQVMPNGAGSELHRVRILLAGAAYGVLSAVTLPITETTVTGAGSPYRRTASGR